MPAEFILGLLAEESASQAFGLARRGFSDSEHQTILGHVLDALKKDLPPGRDGIALYQSLNVTLGGNKPSWYIDGILQRQSLQKILFDLLLPINEGIFETDGANSEKGTDFLRRIGWELPRMVEVVENALLVAVKDTAVEQGRLPEVLRQSDVLRINAVLARIESKADLLRADLPSFSRRISAKEEQERLNDFEHRQFFMPMGSATLVGREGALQELSALVESSSRNRNRSEVFIVHGMPGVGKTAFCLELARRLSGANGIGNVPFFDLKGWTPNTVPLPSEAALGELLLSVGFPQILPSLEGRMAQWRGLIQSRAIRVIVLDNAFSSEQIRPLLDIDSPCVILVTSRDRLPTIQDANRYELSVVGKEDTRQFLVNASQLSQAPIDEVATSRLADLSGGLPLAFRVIASRLAESQSVSIGDLVTELSDRKDRLRGLHVADLSVLAAIDVSYQRLSVTEKRALAFLAILPITTFRPDMLSSLLEISILRAKQVLVSLERQAILQLRGLDTWEVHDLILSHVRSESSKVLTDSERYGAYGRMPVWWKATKQHAGGGVQFSYLASGNVAVRDGKNPSGAILYYTVQEWENFMDAIRRGDFDHLV